jgi:hypothetical protein
MNVDSLTRKAGPLPVWAWAALILGAVWFFFLRGSSSSSATTSSTPSNGTGGAGLSGGGGAADSGVAPPLDVQPGSNTNASTSADVSTVAQQTTDTSGGFANEPQGSVSTDGTAAYPTNPVTLLGASNPYGAAPAPGQGNLYGSLDPGLASFLVNSAYGSPAPAPTPAPVYTPPPTSTIGSGASKGAQ